MWSLHCHNKYSLGKDVLNIEDFTGVLRLFLTTKAFLGFYIDAFIKMVWASCILCF